MSVTTTLPASVVLNDIGETFTESGNTVIGKNSGEVVFNYDDSVASVSYSFLDTQVSIDPGTGFANRSFDLTTQLTITAVGGGSTSLVITANNATVKTVEVTVTQAPADDESYLNKRGLTHFWENIDDIKQDKLTAGAGISITGNTISATGGGTADAVDWGHITGSMSNQTDLTTALNAKANSADLATVATSGSYNDLTNKPTIPTVNNATLTIQKNGTTVKTFTANASSNVTANITVPTKTSDLTNDSGYLTTVAWGDVTGKPTFATVATSGSYNDLSDKPTIPAAQVNSDWDAVSGVAQILNKPTLATVATSGSYNDLSNKPTIPTVNNATLTIQKNGTTVKTFTANASSNVTANITVPTKTSDLTNDSGYLTTVAWGDVTGKPTFATVATSGSYNDLSNKPTIPTVNNATLTIQKNGTNVQTFTANSSSNKTANITVPTTVAELSDASDYATTTDLAAKQNLLSPGDHIDITSNIISATGYVHSENPQASAAASSTITGSMIASGTITADKLATGATVKLTMSTSDIGEGAPLAANTLYGVYI